jgi:hypothetical protein
MSAWDLLETLVLALAVFASLLVVWRAVHPDSLRRARADLALAWLAPGRARWVKALGRRIAPKPRVADAGRRSACGGCGGDASKGDCGGR